MSTHGLKEEEEAMGDIGIFYGLLFLLLLPLINNKILDWKMTLTAEKKGMKGREKMCVL